MKFNEEEYAEYLKKAKAREKELLQSLGGFKTQLDIDRENREKNLSIPPWLISPRN